MKLQYKNFTQMLLSFLADKKDCHLYKNWIQDHLEKVGAKNAGYAEWLERSFAYLHEHYRLQGRNVLEIGCGMGEFVVTLRKLGYQAWGCDVFLEELKIARTLSLENDQPPSIVQNSPTLLPFQDKVFDVVHLFSVVEHLNGRTLKLLLPEIERITRGVVYILVPNRLKGWEDHVGLPLLTFFPRRIAEIIIKSLGKRYRYAVSQSGTWDVYYRTFATLKKKMQPHFEVEMMPLEFIYPPFSGFITSLWRNLIPIPTKFLIRQGFSPVFFEPYMNFVLVTRSRPDNS